MTPEEQGDLERGSGQKTGQKTDSDEFSDGYERRKSRQRMRELEEKIVDLENRLTERQWGLDEETDPRIRNLVLEQKRMREELNTILHSVLRSDEDEALEPFMQEVLDENPELDRAYPNRIKRLEAIRTMARGKQAEAAAKSSVGRRDKPSPARVHLAGGGPSASRRSRSDDDFAEFKRKMADRSLSSEERLKLAQKWDAEHPEE